MPFVNGRWMTDEEAERAGLGQKQRLSKKFEDDWVPYSQRNKPIEEPKKTKPRYSETRPGQPPLSLPEKPKETPKEKSGLEKFGSGLADILGKVGKGIVTAEPILGRDTLRGIKNADKGELLGKTLEGLKGVDRFASNVQRSLLGTATFGLSDKLEQTVTRGLSEDEKAKLGFATRTDSTSDKVAGAIGSGAGMLLGGAGLAKAGTGLARSSIGRGLAQRGREITNKTGLPLMPKPTAQLSRGEQLSKNLAKYGAGTGAMLGGRDLVEGFTDPNIEEKNSIQRFAGNVRAGMYDTYSQIGSALKWADFNEAGKKMQDLAKRNQKGFETPYSKEFSWKSFLDPEYYQTTVARSLPSVFSTLPLALVGGAGGAAVGGAIGMGALGRTIMGAVGGTALSAPAESAMIAGGVYEEALKRGDDENTANEKAKNTFYKTLAVTAVTQAPELISIFAPIRAFLPQAQQFLGTRGEIALRAGTAGLSEGIQETAQEWAVRSELGDDFSLSDPSVQESFALGALLGGGMGAIGAIGDTGQDFSTNTIPGISPDNPDNPVQRIKAQVKEELPDDLKAEYNRIYDEAVKSGADMERADNVALEQIARTEKGKKVIQDATLEIVDKEAKTEFTQRQQTGNMPTSEVTQTMSGLPSQQEFDRLTRNESTQQGGISQDEIDRLLRGDFTPEEQALVDIQREQRQKKKSGDLLTQDSQPTIDSTIQQTTPLQRPFGPFSETSSPQGPALPRPSQVSTPSFGTPLTEQQRQQQSNVPQGPKQQMKKGDMVRVKGENGVFEVAETQQGGKKQKLISPSGEVKYVRHQNVSRANPMVFQEGDDVKVKDREGKFTITDLRKGKPKIKLTDENGEDFFVRRQEISLTTGGTAKAETSEKKRVSEEAPKAQEEVTKAQEPVKEEITTTPEEVLTKAEETTTEKTIDESETPQLDEELSSIQREEQEKRSSAFEGATEAKKFLKEKETFDPTHSRKETGKKVEAVTFTDDKGNEQVVFAGEDERPLGPISMDSFLKHSEPLEETQTESTEEQVESTEQQDEKPSDETQFSEVEAPILSGNREIVSWFRKQSFTPTHIKEFSTGPSEEQAIFMRSAKDGDMWVVSRKSADDRPMPSPLSAYENHITKRIPGAVTYRFTFKQETERITFKKNGETDEEVIATSGKTEEAKTVETKPNKKPFTKLEDWNEYANKNNLGRAFKDPKELKATDLMDMVENWSDSYFTGVEEDQRKAYLKYAEKVYKEVNKLFQSRAISESDLNKTSNEILSPAEPKAVEESTEQEIEKIDQTEKFKMPWEMSLDEFMKDDKWKAVYAKNKESKQAHWMDMPNGKQFPGGWVAHGRTPKQAKENFHKEQIRYQLRKDHTAISPEALSTYEDLKQDMDNFNKVYKAINVTDDGLSIKVDGKTKTFTHEEIPERLGLMESRGFVKKNNLVGEERSKWQKGQWDIQEVVANSIENKLNDFIKTKFDIGETVDFKVDNKTRGIGVITDIKNNNVSIDRTDKSRFGSTEHHSNRWTDIRKISESSSKQPEKVSVPKPTPEPTTETTAESKNRAKVVTPAGSEIEIEYDIVDGGQLITSHTLNNTINPKFPKELQPRDRSSMDSKAQISKMARTLDPLRLGENRLVTDGAPIIGPDNVVESGNGRTLAIMSMYQNPYFETQESYKEFLKNNEEKFGINVNIENMEMPVLVRRRLTDVEREQFVIEANESTVSTMGATETALADAKKIKKIIHLFVPSESGDINTAINKPFIDKYINDVVPASDRRSVRTSEGYLSQDGKERLERSLFALAFNDDNAIARYSEDLDDNARTVTGAMVDVAPKMAAMNGDIKNNVILEEFEISSDVVSAFNKLVELRRLNEDVGKWIEEDKKQESLFDDTKLSDVAYELLYQFNAKKSRKRIRGILSNYVDYVTNDPRSKGEDLFGERATKAEFLELAIERVDGGGSLFEIETQISNEQAQASSDTTGTKKEATVEKTEKEKQKLTFNEIPETAPKGFQNGFALKDFRKGDTAYTYVLDETTNAKYHLVEGTIDEIIKRGKEIVVKYNRQSTEFPIPEGASYGIHIYDHSVGTKLLKRSVQAEETKAKIVNPLPENPDDVDKEHFEQYKNSMKSLIDDFVSKIESDTFPSGNGAQKEIRKITGEVIGRPPLEDEWRDALEVSIQLVAEKRRLANPDMTLKERIDSGMELEKFMKQSGRSLEQMERQQYSTPIPLAEIANYVADPRSNDTVKEGSAGTGSLIIPMIDKVKSINAIELSPRRAALLDAVSIDNKNINVINSDTFKQKLKASLVIGNPPFKGQNVGKGSVALSGKSPWKGGWGDLGNRFLNWDLRSLSDGGRLVYITSPGVVDNKQNSEFRKWLQENHTVRAMIKMPGDIYDTRGTKFGAGLIVVDKGKVSDEAPIKGEAKTLEELEDMLSPLREGGTHGRNEVVQPKTAEESPSGTGGSNESPGVRKPKPRPGPGKPSTKPTDSDRVELDSYTDPNGNIVTGERLDRQNEGGSVGRPTNKPGLSDKASEVLPERVPREPIQSKSDELSTIESNKKSIGKTTDNVSSVVGYVPKRRVTNSDHKGNVIEAPGMQFVNVPEQIYTNNEFLPHENVIKGGEWILSDIQIEAVMAAKYNYLENDKKGILIADDTGIGKTAEQLGIAADAWHSGRNKRILIVTTKDQVAESSFLAENKKFGFDIPMLHINPEYAKKLENNFKDKTQHDTPEAWEPLDYGDGAIVMSKYTFRDSQQAITKWLEDTDGDVMVLLDESHDYKNIESKLGEAMKNLYSRIQDRAQFNYSSATAAEDIEGLEHLFGLKLWGTNNFSEFEERLTGSDVSSISGGKKKTGLAKSMSKKSPFERSIPLTLMEQITREMKTEGQYIGRQLSMEGVTMDGLNVKLTPKDKGDWNRAVQFIQMVANKAEEHGKKPTDRGRIMGSVVGYMRRLRSYYALKGIIEDIKTQQSSGEFNRFAISAFFKSGDEGEPAQLQSAINVINDQAKAKDSSGEEITVDIPEAIEDKADLQAILQGLDPEWGDKPVPEIPSPIDMLYQAFGEDNVAVVHGDITAKNRPKVVKEFQDGKKSIIWFNQAGATGVNMHDTIGEPIRFYHQDYPYSAKEAKQSEGRVNRTGQVTTPTYVYPYLDTSVDTKFVGTLMARYEAMGALSRGDTGKLGGQELSSFDFTGPAVEEAAYRIIPLLEPDVRAQMFGNWTRDMFEDPESANDQTAIRSVYSGNKVEVKKFMNALMLLDFDEGNRVFKQFTDVVDVVKKELESKGGMVDKFQTYNGIELDVQEGKNGLKLRKISTKLTEQQDKQLKIKLKMAKEQEKATKENLEIVKENVFTKQKDLIEDTEGKQREEQQELSKIQDEIRPYVGRRNTEKELKELERLRNKQDKLMETINRRRIRLNIQEQKLKDIEKGNEDVLDSIPDMRRAQSQADRAELMLLSAESEIDKSKEVLLIDGRIATNGLLVPIRKAIRKAADKHFNGKTPASALNVELRGYYLDGEKRVVGAVVPKWAENEVATALEARLSFTGDAKDIAVLKEYVRNGNPITLENEFEIRWQPKLEQFQIWGMTPSKHRPLFEQLVGDKKKPDIGYHQTSRSFVILTDEGFGKLIQRFPIQTDVDSNQTPGTFSFEQSPDLEFNAKRLTDPSKRVTPKTAKQVADRVAKQLDTVLRGEKTPRKNILGQFSPNTGTGKVRQEKLHEFRVAAHELGHAFSHRFKFKGDMDELINIAETYYPSKLKGKKLKVEEGLAEYFQLWFVDPDEAERLAPKTTERFMDFISQNPELEKVFEDARTIIDEDLQGTPLQKALGSIVGVKEQRLTEHIGEEYKIGDVSRIKLMKYIPLKKSWKEWIDRSIQRTIVNVFDFTLPFRDLYNKAKENDFEGVDFTKLMAISGGALEKSRRVFTDKAIDHQGRLIINYRTKEELPDFLLPKYDELSAKYGDVKKALEEINSRSLQGIMSESMEHIVTRMKSAKGTELDNLKSGFKADLKADQASDIFSAIAQAYRYNERYERGFKDNPMDRDVAEGTIEQSQQLFPELENLIKEYTHNLSQIILEKLNRSGVITDQAKQNILGGSSFYIPTFYATESTPTPSGTSQSGRTAGLPVKRYGGKKQAVHHVLTATMMKLNEVEQTIEYKRILDGVEGALRTKETGMFGEIVPENLVPIRFSGAQIEKQIDELINESTEEQDIGDKVLSIFIAGGLKSFGNKPVIMNWHDDKRVYMRLAPDVFNALMAMRPADVSGFMKFMAKLSGITRYSVTTLNPRYIINAVARDFMSAGLQKADTRKLFQSRSIIKSTFKGAIYAIEDTKLGKKMLKSFMTEKKAKNYDDLIDQYMASGAFMSATENVLQSFKRNNITDGLIPTKVKGVKKIPGTNTLTFVANAPGEIMKIQEQMQRFPEFEERIRTLSAENGIDPEIVLDPRRKIPKGKEEVVEKILVESAYAASEVTANFSLHGTSDLFRQGGSAITFLHGTLQGFYRESRAFRNGKTTIPRLAIYTLPVTVAAWFMLQEFSEDEEEIPSETKDRYWIFPIPGTRFKVSIAKPFMYALPINYLERFMDDMLGSLDGDVNERDFGDEWFNPIKQAFSFPFAPPIISTMIGLKANEQWHGGPIVPMGEQQLAKTEQFDYFNTSDVSIATSRLLDSMGMKTFSPREMDYFFSNTFGGLGDFALGTGSLLTKPFVEERPGKQNVIDRLMGEAEFKPLIGSLIMGPTEGGSRSVDHFYKKSQESNALNSTAKKWYDEYLKTDNVDHIKTKVKPEDITLIQYNSVLKRYSSLMSDLRNSEKEFRKDPTKSPEEKYQKKLRTDYYIKVIANAPFGNVPSPPKGLDITNETIDTLSSILEVEKNDAYQNEVKRKGGASLHANFLQAVYELQQQNK